MGNAKYSEYLISECVGIGVVRRKKRVVEEGVGGCSINKDGKDRTCGN